MLSSIRLSVLVTIAAVLGTGCGTSCKAPLDMAGESSANLEDAAEAGGEIGKGVEERVIPASIPDKVVVEAGEKGRVEVTVSPLGAQAFWGDELVWNAGDSPLLIGRVAQYDPAMRYDPEIIPDGVMWISPENPVEYRFTEEGEHQIIFEPLPACRLVLGVRASGEGVVTFDLGPKERSGEVLVRLSYRPLDDQENFYGLGESFDKVARRGTHRHMYITFDGSLESGNNEAHFPIPLLVSTRGSGVFIEDRHPGYFDVCESDPDRVEVTFSTHRLRFHVLLAPSPLEVLSRYSAIVGYPSLPPRWAFGVIQWRNEVSGQQMVMDDARAMREHDLPCSGIWVDRPFATAHESFVFDPVKFPDSKQMVKDLNDLGYRVAIWSAPYLSEELVEEYAEAEANGYFVEGDIQFNKFGRLMDFTNPEAVKFWQKLISNATGIGIEGFKLDYGEDVISGWLTIKPVMKFYNGEGADTMHHWYHWFYHKTYREMLGEEPFLLTRAGCYGDQSITTVCWPGDLDADFHYHGEDGYVGGLPAAIIGMQTLSMSGYPFYGSDTGGFRHFRPTKEVLVRWVEHTALSTTLQFGGAGSNTNPWDFSLHQAEKDGVVYISQFDEETLNIWRKFSRLHIRLFPYLYTFAVKASVTGIPVIRPYGIVFPQEGKHPDFEYMVGDSLLVAPVYRQESVRSVSIPKGVWYDWFDGTRYQGPWDMDFEVPLDRLVLLAREGAVVPMLRESVDTLAPASSPEVDSFAEEGGALVVRIFPGLDGGRFECVLGPSVEFEAIEKGYRIAFDSVTPAFDSIRLEVNLSGVDGGPFDHPVVEMEGGGVLKEAASAQEAVECEGCWFLDKGGLLTITPAPGKNGAVIVFQGG